MKHSPTKYMKCGWKMFAACSFSERKPQSAWFLWGHNGFQCKLFRGPGLKRSPSVFLSDNTRIQPAVVHAGEPSVSQSTRLPVPAERMWHGEMHKAAHTYTAFISIHMQLWAVGLFEHYVVEPVLFEYEPVHTAVQSLHLSLPASFKQTHAVISFLILIMSPQILYFGYTMWLKPWAHLKQLSTFHSDEFSESHEYVWGSQARNQRTKALIISYSPERSLAFFMLGRTCPLN